jgi:hypothetical protein
MNSITHHFADGLYAKQANIKAGCLVGKHRHTYTHLSILAAGKVEVMRLAYINGESHVTHEIIEAPACIEIKAEVLHEITAIEDSVWFCIHATNERDINNIDNVLITKGR